MKTYKSHKIVQAAKITSTEDVGTEGRRSLLLNLDDGDDHECNAAMLVRYTPKAGDYLVKYGDGYLSISPKAAFEEGYVEFTEGDENGGPVPPADRFAECEALLQSLMHNVGGTRPGDRLASETLVKASEALSLAKTLFDQHVAG